MGYWADRPNRSGLWGLPEQENEKKVRLNNKRPSLKKSRLRRRPCWKKPRGLRRNPLVLQDRADHLGIHNRSDIGHLTSAVGADVDVDLENSLQKL